MRAENGRVLFDLEKPGEECIVVKGGAGGRGNAYFLSNEVRAPTTYELGGEGERKTVHVELSLIADVGLVSLTLTRHQFILQSITIRWCSFHDDLIHVVGGISQRRQVNFIASRFESKSQGCALPLHNSPTTPRCHSVRRLPPSL